MRNLTVEEIVVVAGGNGAAECAPDGSNITGGVLAGAGTGAIAGASGGPVGVVVGALGGAVAGAFGGLVADAAQIDSCMDDLKPETCSINDDPF